MTTREEISSAVERVVSLGGEYRQICEESAAANQQRWEALREAHGDRRAEGVLATDSRVADTSAASVEALTALGQALVEVHSLRQRSDRE